MVVLRLSLSDKLKRAPPQNLTRLAVTLVRCTVLFGLPTSGGKLVHVASRLLALPGFLLLIWKELDLNMEPQGSATQRMGLWGFNDCA